MAIGFNVSLTDRKDTFDPSKNSMKNTVVLLLVFFASFSAFSQDSTVIDTLPFTPPTPSEAPPKKWSNLNLNNRSNDHLLIQVGYDNWAQKPDSLQIKGLSRSFSIYFMFDFPFKTNPHFSIGVGAGVSTSNIYFENTSIDLTGRLANKLSFVNVKDTNHFKKYKLLTTFLEAPVEFRYVSNPANSNKSWKAAIGAKIGTMISAGTKGKNLQNKNGQTINSFTQKEKSKRYFNSTRLSLTGRIGYGSFSLFTSYQINSFIKEGFGPDVRPYTIGLTLSGL
jgi:hypothetical protein